MTPSQITPERSSAPGADLSPRAAGLGLAVLTLLALALRLAGLGFMLPHFAHIDERVYACQVDLFRGLERFPGETENYAFYPELVPWITSNTTPVEVARAPARNLEEQREVGSAKIVSLRFTVAWLAVLLVPGTYFLARRFTTRRVALTAAIFVALSVLHDWHSQQARPHAVLATTTLGAVLGSLLVLRRGDLRAYMIAGLACGLAIATLQSGSAVLAALCAAHVLRRHDRSWRAQVHFLIALAICLVSARVFYPFVFDPGTGRIALGFWNSGGHVELSGHGMNLSDFNGGGFAPLAEALVDFDPLITVFACVGLIVCFASLVRSRMRLENGRAILVVSAHALPYLLVIGMWQRSYQRFLLPLLPYLAILAAFGLWWMVERVTRRGAIRAAIVATVVTAQAFTVLKLVQLRRADDTATEAADWIATHLQRTDRIALVPTLDLPLLRQDRGLIDPALGVGREYRPWPRYQLTIPAEERALTAFDVFNMPVSDPRLVNLLLADPAAYVREIGADYVVVQEFGPEIRRNLGRLRDAVRKSGTLVARFTPWREDRSDDTPLLYYWDSEFAAEKWLAWRMLAMRSFGAPVEIYRMGG